MSISPRNCRIDLMRGIAILLVLFHHFNIAYHLNDTLLSKAFGWEAVRAMARNGNYGVTMFFVISGYLITSNADSRWSGIGNINARVFYGLRMARILPGLLLLLVTVNLLAMGGVAIFQNHASEGAPVPFWLVNLASVTFWMNVLVAAHGWVNYPLGVLWSLSVEEVFYLSFPILCLVFRRESHLISFLVVIIVIGPLYRFIHQGDEAEFLYAYFACFDGIAIGCCTALLAKQIALRGTWSRVLQALVAAAMAVLYLYKPIGETNIVGVTAMALGTALLLLGARHHADESNFAGNRPLAAFMWFGRFSYELYLFHLIVLGAMRTVFPPRVVAGDEKLLLLVAFLMLSAALSAGIAHFYAEPLNRGLRRRLAAGRVAVPSG